MFKAPIRTPLYLNKVLIYKGVSTSVDMKNLCIYKLYIWKKTYGPLQQGGSGRREWLIWKNKINHAQI